MLKKGNIRVTRESDKVLLAELAELKPPRAPRINFDDLLLIKTAHGKLLAAFDCKSNTVYYCESNYDDFESMPRTYYKGYNFESYKSGIGLTYIRDSGQINGHVFKLTRSGATAVGNCDLMFYGKKIDRVNIENVDETHKIWRKYEKRRG